MWVKILFLNISQYKYQCLSVLFNVLHRYVLCTLSAGFATMAGLKNACDCFAYTIDSKEGGYVLNITNAAAILIRDETTGDFAADVLRCPPIVPNLPYSEINITITINGGKEPMIMRMHSGPKGDLWIRKDGPNHR